jgi:dynein heavy chain
MVCEVQYGGKMIDERDREILNSYGDDIFKSEILKPDLYELIPKSKYIIPRMDVPDIGKIKDDISKNWPAQEEPAVFGLSNLADKAYRARESKDLLAMLIEALPKEYVAGAEKSREEETKERLEKDIKQKLPPLLKNVEKREKKMTPMIMFLAQEVRRFQNIHVIIAKAIQEITLAIDGQILMTPEIEDAIQSLYNGRVPHSWMYDSLGAEWSWVSQSSAGWFRELNQKHSQLNTWLRNDKLGSYWLGGFFNPKGFLFAFKQEDYRKNKMKDGSTLDKYELVPEVLPLQQWTEVDKFDYKATQGKRKDKEKDESGILVHGMYIEGAICVAKGLDDCKNDILNQLQIVRITVDEKSDNPKPSYPTKSYYCPVYRYASRGDENLIMKIRLEPAIRDADYFRKKGVAILCSKEYIV